MTAAAGFSVLTEEQVQKIKSIEGNGYGNSILAELLDEAMLGAPSLTSAQIIVGNGSNEAVGVAMSGQATISNTGAVTLSNAAVIAKVLTGYAAGTEGSVSALAATDSILEGIQKLDGNKASYVATTFSATFDHSVGAKTVVAKKVGHVATLEIPAGALSDGAGTVVASGATDIPAAYRPATTLTFPVLVIDNGTTRKIGQVVIASTGVITFSVLGTGFTNAAAAGWDRCAVTYTTA